VRHCLPFAVPEQTAKLPFGAREKVVTQSGAVSSLIIRHFGRHPHLTGEMRVFLMLIQTILFRNPTVRQYQSTKE
jgi:hypothetical protein